MEQMLASQVREQVEDVEEIIDLELLRTGDMELFQNDSGVLFMREPEMEGQVPLGEVRQRRIAKIKFEDGVPKMESVDEEEFKNQDLNSVVDIDSEMAD